MPGRERSPSHDSGDTDLIRGHLALRKVCDLLHILGIHERSGRFEWNIVPCPSVTKGWSAQKFEAVRTSFADRQALPTSKSKAGPHAEGGARRKEGGTLCPERAGWIVSRCTLDHPWVPFGRTSSTACERC